MDRRASQPMGSVVSAFRSCERRLRAFARRFVASDVEVDDICQETVMRAIEAEQQRTIASPEAFLFGVARNVVRKQLDRQSRSLIDFVDGLVPDQHASDDPPLGEGLDDRRRLLLFAQVVATLPPQCQRVFVMKRVYGYSQREIAAKLKISESTVEKHVATGLKRCLDEIEKREHEPGKAAELGR